MIFTYTAIDKDGKTQQDEIDVASYHEAVLALHNKGLMPTELKEKSAKSLMSMNLGSFSKVKLQDKILFVQNLSIIMRAGIPLTKGLKILSVQTKNPKFKEALIDIHKEVESGKSFSEALQKYPKIFENIFVSMVKVGEVSGNLDKNLEYLGVQLQREHDLVSKTKGAMIYPSVIVVTIFLVGIAMSIFVLPNLISVFEQSNIQLPLATRIIVAFTHFMSNHTLLALTLIFGTVGGAWAILRTKAGTVAFDKALLRAPIFGEIDKKINIARFSRIMSSMLKSGTPILEGLQICGSSMGNSQYNDALALIAADVKVGKTMSESMEKHPRLFSYLVTQMIGVGEEAGNVDTILGELAEHYEAEVDETMRNLSSIIEPVLLLVIGGVVGVLAVALISPIYNLTQAQ